MSAPPSPYLVALTAHAHDVPAEERERFRRTLAGRRLTGGVTLVTCHRVEAYLEPGPLTDELERELPHGGRRLEDAAAAARAVRLALGLESTVLAEDQVLHQLREAVETARARGRLAEPTERLFRIALREGRRTRAWQDRPPRSLADVAMERLERALGTLNGRRLLVVGTGEMGRLLLRAAGDRGALVAVAGRDAARSLATAAAAGADVQRLDPGRALATFDAIAIALAARWELGETGRDVLRRSRPVVVDLSAPSALGEDSQHDLGERFISIDDLAGTIGERADDRLRGRLEAVAEAAAAEFLRWLDSRHSTVASREIAVRAEGERIAELEHLWRRLPHLGEQERAAIDGMSRHLASRILREPLARLGEDEDGRRAAAARDLFGL